MSSGQNVAFPRKLFDLIGAEPNWLVEWASHGESFFIRNEEEFCAQVLPKYFRHTKLTSFQRQLNLYGFRRITKGEDTGAYFHPFFSRDNPVHVDHIKRVVRKGGAASPPIPAAAASTSSAKHDPRGINITPSTSSDPHGASPVSPHSFPDSNNSRNSSYLSADSRMGPRNMHPHLMPGGADYMEHSGPYHPSQYRQTNRSRRTSSGSSSRSTRETYRSRTSSDPGDESGNDYSRPYLSNRYGGRGGGGANHDANDSNFGASSSSSYSSSSSLGSDNHRYSTRRKSGGGGRGEKKNGGTNSGDGLNGSASDFSKHDNPFDFSPMSSFERTFSRSAPTQSNSYLQRQDNSMGTDEDFYNMPPPLPFTGLPDGAHQDPVAHFLRNHPSSNQTVQSPSHLGQQHVGNTGHLNQSTISEAAFPQSFPPQNVANLPAYYSQQLSQEAYRVQQQHNLQSQGQQIMQPFPPHMTGQRHSFAPSSVPNGLLESSHSALHLFRQDSSVSVASDGGFELDTYQGPRSPQSARQAQPTTNCVAAPNGVTDFPRSSSAMSAELNQSINSEGWQFGIGDDSQEGKEDELMPYLEGLDQFDFETNFETGVMGSTHCQHPSATSLMNQSLGSMGSMSGYLSLGSPTTNSAVPLPLQQQPQSEVQQFQQSQMQMQQHMQIQTQLPSHPQQLGTGPSAPIPVNNGQSHRESYSTMEQQQQQPMNFESNDLK